MLKVRIRLTDHGGQDIDAPELWQKWFDGGEKAASDRDNALFAEPTIRRDEDDLLLWE
jgi:uncharacterized protein